MPPLSPLTVRAFGSLRLVRDGVETEVSRRRERNVLAVLLAVRGRPVSPDRLVVDAWGEEAPPQALASLQVAVSRLRRMLEPERSPRMPATVLLSTAAGYSISLPEDAVDVWQFDALVDRVRAVGDASERSEAADAACARWAGSPFAGCDAEPVVREAERLDEQYVAVREAGALARLDLGEPDAAVVALEPLLSENPYRERLWAAHALGLYRTARQGEALDSLRILRERLADDLGIDPSPEVAALEMAILNQDPALLASAAPPRAPVPEVVLESPSAPGRRGDLVGRAAGLATLRERMHEVAARGHAEFVVVSGEPGIGKSRLVAQLPDLAPSATVEIGRSHPDFAPALWPWLPVLRALWERSPDPADAELVAPLLTDLRGEPAASQGDVLRLFDAAVRLIARAAAEHPLILVLEDLHWADVTSLRLLAHLAAHELPAPVLVVATMRAGEVASSEALVATMADLARAGAARIRLEGLSRVDVADLLGEVLGPHDERLDDVVAHVTAGNPFFVLEYARLVQGLPDLHRIDVDRLPVPEGVRDVLRQRLARLPESARSLLGTAAVAGRIEPELLSVLTGTPVEEVLDLLDLTLASGIISDTGTGYEFAHALTREALAGDLTAARRVRLHDQVSRAVEAQYGDLPDVLAEVAHHADLAASLGPEAVSRAAISLARAARVAEARLAYDEALELWRRTGLRAGGPHAVDRRVEALIGAAHCLFRLARAAEARAAVVEGTRVARQAGRWDLVADAAATLNRGGVWTWREPGTREDDFVSTLHEALVHVDDARRARLLAALQIEHYYAWEGPVGDELGERALEVARATGDQDLLAEVLLAHVVATAGPGNARARLARCEELRTHSLGGETAAFTEFIYARTLYECAQVDEADAAAARCAAAVTELRHTGVDVPLAWWLHSRARDAEDPVRVADAWAVLAAQHQRGDMTGAGIDLVYRLWAADPDGPLDAGLVDATRDASPGLRALVAYDVLERGDARTAVELLGEPSPPGASDYSVLAERCLRVAVLVGADEDAGLGEAVERIRPYSGDVVMFGAVEHLGAVDYFLALGTAALGDLAAAERYCAGALTLLERLGNRPWRRRAEVLASQLGGRVDPSR